MNQGVTADGGEPHNTMPAYSGHTDSSAGLKTPSNAVRHQAPHTLSILSQMTLS